LPGKIIWIDDIPEQVNNLAEAPSSYLAVIVDLLMDTENFIAPGQDGPELIDTFHGLLAGMVFGRWAKRNWPFLNMVGVSVKADLHDEQVRWFKETGDGYFDKYSLYTSITPLLLLLKRLAAGKKTYTGLKTYIVHGRDTSTLEKLRRYLRTSLRIPNQIIIQDDPAVLVDLLAEGPEEAGIFKLIFVILTSASPPAAEEESADKLHSWENILFKTGFLCGRSVGGAGKVMVLHAGDLRLPEEISGASLIDISAGLETADEQIRREVLPYLSLMREG
jgi:hypothetical protein